MKVNSAKKFRMNYAEERQKVVGYDADFVGCEFKNETGKIVRGFFEMFHGDKNDIRNFLSSQLKIAEDGQAIYEFLQNAADEDSTLFYLFYDDDYFVAVNNGNVFSEAGLKSLLNVAQSGKKDSTKIGRFGVGFKLVHRLVGKSDGMDELLEDYAGPILFSWSKKDDLLALMRGDEVEDVCGDDKGLPYLMKLILTNFPAGVNESVKNLNYENQILFTKEEYEKMSLTVKKYLEQYVDSDNFDQGTLFFIKLGKEKRALLDKDYEKNLKGGVEYALNTLKNLKNVKINGVQISEVKLKLEKGKIEKDSVKFKEISPEYKNADINFEVGYNEIDFTQENPFEQVEMLKKSPTFYKYFPMGDEIHNSALFLHCDAFSNELNRRKLHEDNVNKKLLPEIAKFVNGQLDDYKKVGDRNSFLQLYANVLLSTGPHENSEWLKSVFFDILNNNLKSCIPTLIGYCDNSDFVKIRATKVDVPLYIVNPNYQWFKWMGKKYQPLLEQAKSRLGLKTYTTIDFLKEVGNIDLLNDWLDKVTDEIRLDFVEALNLYKCDSLKEKIKQLRLFKFSDSKYYSWNDIVSYKVKEISYYIKKNIYYYKNNILFLTSNIEGIKTELLKLGFVVSNLNIDNYANIKSCFEIPSNDEIFELFKGKVSNNNLNIGEKQNFIRHLGDVLKISSSSISSLPICRNICNEYKPLCDMLSRGYNIPSWLNKYQIADVDYFVELDKYLILEKNIYSDIILNKWNELIDLKETTQNVREFYEKIKYFYNLKPGNKLFSTEKFVYSINGQFCEKTDLVLNKSMLKEGINYNSLSNIITTVFDGFLPQKDIASILFDAPFNIKECNLSNYLLYEKAITKEDVDNFILLYELNNESLFSYFVVKKVREEYFVLKKETSRYQVYVDKQEVKHFISEHCKEMILLPDDLTYKNGTGIIKNEDLYDKIIEIVDVNALKESLIDIVQYNAVKEKFLGKINEFRFNLDQTISKTDYSFKVVDMACSILKTEKLRIAFRKKIFFDKENISYNFEDIVVNGGDSINIEGLKQPLSLAKILPNECGNEKLLTDFVRIYVNLGIVESSLKCLLGIDSVIDIDQLKDIYEKLKNNYDSGLENEQQLAFALLMAKYYDVELFEYKLKTVSGEFYSGEYCLLNKIFIDSKYVLSEEYADLGKFVELPYCNDKGPLFIEKPYIDSENRFIYLELDTLTNEQIDYAKVVNLLEYLKELWENNKNSFALVKWDDFSGNFGFTPSECIYPSEYASNDEKLPVEVESWIAENEVNEQLISALGVHTIYTDDGLIVKCRQFVKNVLSEFDEQKLFSIGNISKLEQTIVWMNDSELFPVKKYRMVVDILIARINNLRNSNNKILQTKEVDWNKLEQNYTEYDAEKYLKWKEKYDWKIYLYKGTIPYQCKIDEYTESIIYYTDSDKDIVCNNEQQILYVNQEKNVEKVLHQFIYSDDNNSNLTKEIFDELNNEVYDENVKLKEEIEELKRENEKLKGATMSYEESPCGGMSKKEMEEANDFAKQLVLGHLRDLGYNVDNITRNEFSCVSGVTKDGKEYPLVIRSYAKKNREFSLSAPDWIQLSQENSMLWIVDSDSKPKCIPFDKLMSKQGNITLRFNTQNFDNEEISSQHKLEALAIVLRWFKGLQFDFSSLSNDLSTSEKLFSNEKGLTDDELLLLMKGDSDDSIK